MDDLISRKQAIDACMKYNGYGSVWACIMGDIKQLPSVTIKDTADKIKVTNCNDLISRQAAINAHCMCSCGKERDEYCKCDDIPLWFDVLPSAQPELIEKAAYIRGFEQSRTQGMIDAQERKK